MWISISPVLRFCVWCILEMVCSENEGIDLVLILNCSREYLSWKREVLQFLVWFVKYKFEISFIARCSLCMMKHSFTTKSGSQFSRPQCHGILTFSNLVPFLGFHFSKQVVTSKLVKFIILVSFMNIMFLRFIFRSSFLLSFLFLVIESHLFFKFECSPSTHIFRL